MSNLPPRVSSPYERMAALAAAGLSYAVATVVRTDGSTPQVIGAKLIVSADARERPTGTLGGGCVEADAIDACRMVLDDGASSLREYRLTEELAWNTGLVCGGTMWILAESGTTATSSGGQNLLTEAARAAVGGASMAFVTRLGRDGRELRYRDRVSVLADGRVVGTFGQAALDRRARAAALEQMRFGTARLLGLGEDGELFIEPVTSRPRLVIAGGGHVAKAIARQARLLDFDVTVLEDRPEFANAERFDGATVVGGDVPAAIASFEYSSQTYLIIATRGHKLDADCVLAAARTSAPYIGLLGSRRKTVLIEAMLSAEGVPDERLAIIHAPVGLDLGGRTPAEIALSVMAEISSIRFGGTGRPLRDSR